MFSNTHAATEVQEKAQVLNVIKKFVEATSCSITSISLNNIYTVEYSKSSSSYYVFWGGDIGCGGGNGNFGRYVTEVYRSSSTLGKFVIDVVEKDGRLSHLYAFDDTIVYDYIASIKKINTNRFEIISWEHADQKWGGQDEGKFPANKFKYILDKKYGRWDVSKQFLLEQKK